MQTHRLVILLAALVLASTSHAHGDHHGAHHDEHLGGLRGDSEPMSRRHLDHMAKAAGATSDQKTKLTAIAKAAQTDIKPMHDQLRANHERGSALYTASTLDRAAIEQHRAAQFQIMDQISRRRMQARLDSAEVLSPEQRSKVAAMVKKHHEGKHHEGRGHGGMHHGKSSMPQTTPAK